MGKLNLLKSIAYPCLYPKKKKMMSIWVSFSICLDPRSLLLLLFFSRVFCFLRQLSLFMQCSSTVHRTHSHFIQEKEY